MRTQAIRNGIINILVPEKLNRKAIEWPVPAIGKFGSAENLDKKVSPADGGHGEGSTKPKTVIRSETEEKELQLLNEIVEGQRSQADIEAQPVNVTVHNYPANAPVVNVEGAEPPVVNVSIEPAQVNMSVEPAQVNMSVEPTPIVVHNNIPEQPTPIINVESPQINVEKSDIVLPAPIINVNVEPTPVNIENTVNVPENPTPVVNVTAEIKPRQLHKVKVDRDMSGKITGLEET
jgi:hypothetical protein